MNKSDFESLNDINHTMKQETPQILKDISSAFQERVKCELIIKHNGNEIKIPCYMTDIKYPNEPPYSIQAVIINAEEPAISIPIKE